MDVGVGGLLAARRQVHHLDVTGTVESLVTPGTDPDSGSNPPGAAAMPYIRLTSAANSSGASAIMDASGSATVADNDLTLEARQLTTFQCGYFLVSQTQAFIQNPGGSQGNLCLGGTIGRYAQDVKNSDIVGAFSLTIDLTTLPAPLNVAVMPGDTWNFQAWFRDDNPGPTSNFTDGLSVQFN